MRPADRPQLQPQTTFECAHCDRTDFLLGHLRGGGIRKIDRRIAAADPPDEPAQLFEAQRIGARAGTVARMQFFQQLGTERRVIHRQRDAGPAHHVLAGERERLILFQHDEGVRVEALAVDADRLRAGHRNADREAAALPVAGKSGTPANLQLLQRQRAGRHEIDPPFRGRACGGNETAGDASNRVGEFVEIAKHQSRHMWCPRLRPPQERNCRPAFR